MKKGFTLIELLVVIAIIGILASIVLVSFPGAQRKARDSRVVSAISQARTIMAYIEANENSYATFLSGHADMIALWDEIVANDRDATTPVINSAAAGACIYAQLSAKDAWYYCADSTGRAGFTAINPNDATYCVGATYVCPAVSG